MIKLENFEVMGWEHVSRGMRNPMNSWQQSDSGLCDAGRECPDCIHENKPCRCFEERCNTYTLGKKDHDLMMRLRKAGTDHRKYMRMITVYVDITAPLYWWKEFDTYKVGTVANSCSTMHKIAAKEFTLDDFSHEHLMPVNVEFVDYTLPITNIDIFQSIINVLNAAREKYLETKDKAYWWQMIQLLPSSYNQKRTVMLNYEVLANIYKSRRNHKLDEWHAFCDWIEGLPYSEIITGIEAEVKE